MTAALAEPPLMPDASPFAAEKCFRRGWECIKPPGHKGQCKMPPGATKRASSGRSTERSAGSSGGASAAPRRAGRATQPTWMAGLLAMGYAGVGHQLEYAGVGEDGEPGPLTPAGRLMQFQAPLAGKQLDEILTKRVPVYKRATSLAGGSLAEDLAPLILGPLLAVAMGSSEMMRDYLAPMFIAVMESSALEVVKLQKQQEEALAAVAEHMSEAQELAKELLDDMFGPSEHDPSEFERESEQADG